METEWITNWIPLLMWKKITRLPSKLYIYHYKSVFWKCYQHITSHHGLYPTQMNHKLISHKHQSNKQCSSSRFNASRLLLKEIRHMTLIMLTVMKTQKMQKVKHCGIMLKSIIPIRGSIPNDSCYPLSIDDPLSSLEWGMSKSLIFPLAIKTSLQYCRSSSN